MPQFPPCPNCGSDKWKRLSLPHPMLIHWILNPGLAFNELVLGQRVPKLQLVCAYCDAPWIERCFVPCPHCSGITSGLHWSSRSSFGNWLGLICPSCGKRIPCLWNVLSLLILALTFPVWYLPYRFHFRNRVSPLPRAVSDRARPPTAREYVRAGIGFAIFGWCVVGGLSLADDTSRGLPPDWKSIMFGAFLCILAGCIFAIVLFWANNRRPKRN